MTEKENLSISRWQVDTEQCFRLLIVDVGSRSIILTVHVHSQLVDILSLYLFYLFSSSLVNHSMNSICSSDNFRFPNINCVIKLHNQQPSVKSISKGHVFVWKIKCIEHCCCLYRQLSDDT